MIDSFQTNDGKGKKKTEKLIKQSSIAICALNSIIQLINKRNIEFTTVALSER